MDPADEGSTVHKRGHKSRRTVLPDAAAASSPVRRCIFDVLNDRSRRRKPCFDGCESTDCGGEDGHTCPREVGALDGGEVTGADRTQASKRHEITPRYARALLRLWREEDWGPPMTVDELTEHGLCKHAMYFVYKEAKNEGEDDQPAAAAAPAAGIGQPTDKLCAHCNQSRKRLTHLGLNRKIRVA